MFFRGFKLPRVFPMMSSDCRRCGRPGGKDWSLRVSPVSVSHDSVTGSHFDWKESLLLNRWLLLLSWWLLLLSRWLLLISGAR